MCSARELSIWSLTKTEVGALLGQTFRPTAKTGAWVKQMLEGHRTSLGQRPGEENDAGAGIGSCDNALLGF